VNVCGNSADGLTPLIRMVKIGDIKMIHMLLEKNSSRRREVDIYRYDQQSMNALIHACTENHIDIVRYLLDYSKIKNNNNNNNNNNIGTTDKSLDSDYVNEYKVDPPIWYACAHGNSDIVQLLIDDYGAKVAYRKDPNIYSSTPLSEACEWGHLSVVKILLERDNNGTSLSSSSSVPDEDEARVRSLLNARELARSAGYNKVVELIDLWSLRIQNIENTFINSNNNIRIEDVNDDNDDDGNDNDDNDGRNNNKDDNDDDDDNGSDNEDENNNNTKKKKQKQKKIDLIPPLLPIVLSMTARRYDLTYRIISRHKDIICHSCQSCQQQ